MIRKQALIKLIVASLVFAAFDLWIFTALLGSYRKYENENSLRKVTLFAKSISAYSNADEWIATLPEVIEGGKVMLLGMDENYNFFPAEGDKLTAALWDSNKDSTEFLRAQESVYYLLPYSFEKSFKVSELRSLSGVNPADVQSSVKLFLLPIPDDSGYDISGAVLMAIPESGALAFEKLLRNLSILAWILFTVLFAVAVLARDPITGYSVVFLFAMAIAFVAYPLLESFRLTFVQNGSFTLNIWKDTFRPARLLALWGSLKLGMITASVSTFVGFVFAFLIERTSIKGKKLIGTLATMPVISPPFSLTLSVILLFGNNGLITAQFLGLKNFSVYGLGGLVMVQTVGMFPIAFMTISSILKSIDSTVEDAAMDLQATKLKTFLSITLPLSLPGLLSAWLLVFTTSLADFANPLLLAGSYRVLSLTAYIEVTGRNNLGSGAALSLLLLFPTLTAFFVQRYWVNKKSVVTITGKPSTRLTELTT